MVGILILFRSGRRSVRRRVAMLIKNDSRVVWERSRSIMSGNFGSRQMLDEATRIARRNAPIMLNSRKAIGRYPANFNGRAREDPTIGEPIITTLLVLSGCWIAMDRLTVPPI